MKASELRIGNKVRFVPENEIVDTLSISESGLKTSYFASGLYELEQFARIPITEDWLLRFGFRKWNDPSKNLHISIFSEGQNGFRFDLDLIEGKFYLKSRYDEENLHCQAFNNLKYVHQLQNLYFALTGTELELKQPVNG